MRYRPVGVALVALLVGLTVLTGTVLYTEADTRGTLLASEQLIDNRTITLDAYDSAYLDQHYNFIKVDGHYYDFFPLGTSILAIPGVALAKALGADVFEQRAALEILLAAFVAAAIVVVLFALARQFVGYGTALTLAALTWFGTTLASTGSTALWSHDFAVLLGSLSLLLMVRIGEQGDRRLWPWLGMSLFLAWLSRPTMALLIPFVFGYLMVRSRRDIWRISAVIAGLFAVFVAFSIATFDQWLPVYYQPARLATETFGEALAGHLVSPSRGLLVFTPVLLVIPLLALLSPRRLRERAVLLVVALGWPLAHWIVVSRHPQWYGGFSYGPRLMTDLIPGLFLAVVLLWPASLRTWASRAVVVLAALLAAFGVWVHTVQGLHNEYTLLWNAAPRIEDRPDKAWDWRHPQFLTNAERESRRLADYGITGPSP